MDAYYRNQLLHLLAKSLQPNEYYFKQLVKDDFKGTQEEVDKELDSITRRTLNSL